MRGFPRWRFYAHIKRLEWGQLGHNSVARAQSYAHHLSPREPGHLIRHLVHPMMRTSNHIDQSNYPPFFPPSGSLLYYEEGLIASMCKKIDSGGAPSHHGGNKSLGPHPSLFTMANVRTHIFVLRVQRCIQRKCIGPYISFVCNVASQQQRGAHNSL